jgi:hypothetical protein
VAAAQGRHCRPSPPPPTATASCQVLARSCGGLELLGMQLLLWNFVLMLLVLPG